MPLPTGRQASIDVPADLDTFEFIGLMAFVASQLPGHIIAASQPASGLVAVRGSIPKSGN